MLKIETGNPQISFDNAIHLMVQHGPIVGVIHRIHPNNTHSSFLFFWDEHVHESTGFACGEKNDNAIYLKSLIAMIPGCNFNIEGDVVFMIGNPKYDKVYNKAQEEKVTVHYIFKPNINIGKKAINNLGYRIFEQYRSDIYTEEKGLMMEVEIPQ